MNFSEKLRESAFHFSGSHRLAKKRAKLAPRRKSDFLNGENPEFLKEELKIEKSRRSLHNNIKQF